MSSIRNKLAAKKTKLSKPKDRVADHPAAVTAVEEGGFSLIDIDQISPDPDQPRKVFDDEALAELSASIRKKGVLQPVIVRRDGSGRVWLVAGERRYRAAKMAGQSKIPAIFTKGDPREIALIENIQRENLKPMEEAEALARLMETHGYRQEHLCGIVNKSKSMISEILSLTRLPEEIRHDARNSSLSRRILIEIARQPEEHISLLYEKAKEAELTVRDFKRVIAASRARVRSRPEDLVVKKIKDLKKSIKKIYKAELNESARGLLKKEFDSLAVEVSSLIS